jgi:Na+-driven multidrug efflux pump
MLGVEGAALATMSAVVLQNVAMLVAAWRRTGVWTAALPLPRRLRPGAARSTGAC